MLIEPNTIQIALDEGGAFQARSFWGYSVGEIVRSDLKDVATPFELLTGKEDAFDCTDEGRDGFRDLTLKFDAQEVVQAIANALEEHVVDCEVLISTLIGNLREEFDGTPIEGEDVVVIRAR